MVRFAVYVMAAVALGGIAAGSAAPTAPAACRVGIPTASSPTGSRLWTVNHRGRFVAQPEQVTPEGRLELKAPWWAAGPRTNPHRGPRGTLVITGRRLDGPAPKLSAQTRPILQHGFVGSGMWAAVISFPRRAAGR